jgi:hypothetical protein
MGKAGAMRRAPTTAWREQTIDEINRELTVAAMQTHCYTCGKRLGYVRYECSVCRELQCSEDCRQQHMATMDAV